VYKDTAKLLQDLKTERSNKEWIGKSHNEA